MPYVDATYYTGTYKGESVNEADFSTFEMRSSEMIDEITSYRMDPDSLLLEPEDIKTRFKNAVCAQIEYISENGGSEVYTSDNIQSAGLGKFNYSSSGSAGSKAIAPMVCTYLNPTGLLYRGL